MARIVPLGKHATGSGSESELMQAASCLLLGKVIMPASFFPISFPYLVVHVAECLLGV